MYLTPILWFKYFETFCTLKWEEEIENKIGFRSEILEGYDTTRKGQDWLWWKSW